MGDSDYCPEEPCYPSESQQDSPHSVKSKDNLEKEAALWILKLKEGRKLAQSAIDEILSDVTEFCTNVVCQLGNDLHCVLNSAGVNPDDIAGFNALVNENSLHVSPFANIQTQCL